MYCKNCGTQMEEQATFCTNCGTAAGQGQNFCPNCATQADPGANVCTNCGTQLVQPAEYAAPVAQAAPVAPVAPKSKTTAGILAILLGSFGVHNFYLGNTGKAVAQLLITVLSCFMLSPVSGIWGLVEGIMILTDSITTDGKGNPLVK